MSKSSLSSESNLVSNLKHGVIKRTVLGLVRGVKFVALSIAALWAGLVAWVQLNDYAILRWLAIIAIVALTIVVCSFFFRRSEHWAYWYKWLVSVSLILWVLLAAWFVWLPAKQDRAWKEEVSHQVSVTIDEANPDRITLHNVRNFDWVRKSGSEKLVQPSEPYYHSVGDSGLDEVAKVRWTERTIDLSKLSGVDIINSYWMGKQVGHTLLSFRFEDDRPLSFSIEIRKEEDESFSALGGFVKQFEMTLIASEERDIVYTRSNIRGEQVYIFPLQGLSYKKVRELFQAYLQQADALNQDAKWYNTLIDNCTTVIFDMARDVKKDRFPWDYRILLSGYVPNYLYDEGLLPHSVVHSDQNDENDEKEIWSIAQWYTNAHINPKVADFEFDDNQDAELYSRKIRQGLPQPSLIKD